MSPGGRSYVVEHPVVREVAYGALSAAKRQEWHVRIGRVLQDLAPDYSIPPGQALHHLVEGDAPRAAIVAAAVDAGDQAMRQSAVSDALRFCGLALQHFEAGLPHASPGIQHFSILERQADALVAAGQWDNAIEEYETLIAISSDPISASRVKRKLASALGDVRGRFDRSLRILTEADEILRHSGEDQNAPYVRIELGNIEAGRSSACFFQSQFRLAVEHGERALEYWSGNEGIDRGEIELLLRIGSAEQRLGNLTSAEDRYRTAIARAAMLGDRVLSARCQDILGGLLGLRGNLIEGQRIHQQVAGTGAELGVPRLEISGLTNTANALCQRGRLLEARLTYEQVLGRAESLRAQYTVMHVLVGLGEALVRLGETSQAIHTLERGIELSREINNVQRRGHAYLHRAELELLMGNAGEARYWVERGMAAGAEIHDIHAQREGLPLLALALTANGQAAEGERAARRGLEITREGGFRLSEGRNLLALGRVLSVLGQIDTARETLSEAEAIARESDMRYDLGWTLYARAAVTADARERETLLQQARSIASELAAIPLARAIENDPDFDRPL